MKKAEPKAPGRIIGQSVLISPSLLYSMYNGIAVTSHGMTIVPITSRNKALRPQKLIRAKPKATIVADSMANGVDTPTTISVFSKNRPNGCAFHASPKLLKCHESGSNWGFGVKISSGAFTAVDSIQAIGNRKAAASKIIRAMNTMECTRFLLSIACISVHLRLLHSAPSILMISK
ncbi:hypothetical protein D3C78_1178430 [compost metagenome]